MSFRFDPERLLVHTKRLYCAAWSLTGSREDAEDLVQETYIRVLAKPRKLQKERELPYLLRVLRNTHIDTYRKKQRRIQPDHVGEEVEFADERSGLQPAKALETQEVFTAIAKLSDMHRDVLVAIDIVGLSYKETSTLLGVPEATVTTRLYRARAKVATFVEGEKTSEK